MAIFPKTEFRFFFFFFFFFLSVRTTIRRPYRPNRLFNLLPTLRLTILDPILGPFFRSRRSQTPRKKVFFPIFAVFRQKKKKLLVCRSTRNSKTLVFF